MQEEKYGFKPEVLTLGHVSQSRFLQKIEYFFPFKFTQLFTKAFRYFRILCRHDCLLEPLWLSEGSLVQAAWGGSHEELWECSLATAVCGDVPHSSPGASQAPECPLSLRSEMDFSLPHTAHAIPASQSPLVLDLRERLNPLELLAV